MENDARIFASFLEMAFGYRDFDGYLLPLPPFMALPEGSYARPGRSIEETC